MAAPTDKVSFPQVLRAAAFLIEHPEQWEEFKMRFGVAAAKAAVKMAETYGLPAEHLAKMKRDLGMD